MFTKVYKEKQFLVFDFENGKTVKYDLSTNTAIGVRGKPVNDLKNQLLGMTINQLIDSCEDKQYAKFIAFIHRKHKFKINNIGTILSKIPKYSRFEQFFSAGLDIDLVGSYSLTKTINDVPKSLLKYARQRKIKISDNLCDYWKHNPDAHCVGYELSYLSLTDEDLNKILTCDKYLGGKYYQEDIYISYFNQLIDVYKYNAKALFLYLDSLKTFEAIDDMEFLMRELYDYAKMMKSISEKFDKYPRHFLTTHKIACRNYNRLQQEFKEDEFQSKINKNYECIFGDYQFIYPKSTQEIKDEAVAQNNCVASYIDDVIDGKCHIMFLRKKSNPQDSLVTIEIKNNQIVQAERRFHYPLTEEDKRAIDYWNAKFINNKEEEVA